MATYYIDPAGNNSTGDGSEGTPWLTVSKFNTESATGDTLICLEGTYAGWSGFNYLNKTLVVQAETGADGAYKSVVFDGSGATQVYAMQNTGGSQGAHYTFKGIKWFDFAFSNAFISGDLSDTNATMTFPYEDCIFHTIRSQNGFTEWRNTRYGTSFTRCKFYKMARNVAQGAGGALFVVHVRDQDVSFINTTIYLDEDTDYYTTLFSIQSATAGSVFTLKNLIVSDKNDLITYGSSSAASNDISYSDFHQITSPPAGTGVITSDPLFVDSDNNNLNLRPTSPAIDTGTLV